MCGRYRLSSAGDTVAELFGIEQLELSPRFNIAPTQEGLVVRAGPAGTPRRGAMLRWGLVPSWAEDPKVGGRQINARAESAATRPAFRDSLRYQRCLVVADGFYEWKLDAGVRQPYLLRRQDQQPFAFAGLWARWRRTDQDPDLDTYAILTVPPNELLRPLHDRMPLILEPEAYARWLDRRIIQPEALADLLTTPTSTGWEAVPVSIALNDARFAGDPLTSPPAQVT